MLLWLFFLVCLLGLVYISLCIVSYSQGEINIRDRVLREREKTEQLLQNKTINVIEEPIVLLCAARDAMHGLPTSLENIRNFKLVCPNLRCVFVENDSVDGTREFIETEFPKVLDTKILQGDVSGHKYKATGKGTQRLHRMIALRNQLINEVQPSDKFFVVYDVDWKVVISVEGFYRALQTLTRSSELEAVCPLLLRPLRWLPFRNCFFDTFAFQDNKTLNMTHAQKVKYLKWKKWYKQARDNQETDSHKQARENQGTDSHKQAKDKQESDSYKQARDNQGTDMRKQPTDLQARHLQQHLEIKEEEQKELIRNESKRVEWREKEEEKEFREFSENSVETIPVLSAFGCMAVYKNKTYCTHSPSSLHLPKYSLSFNQAGEPECEHVQFNKFMGPMAILPQWEIVA